MPNHVSKWGNSLALRLPKTIASDARLREGTAVEMRVEGGLLIVRPARPKYKLSDLLAAHKRAENGEVDWGKAAGEEEW